MPKKLTKRQNQFVENVTDPKIKSNTEAARKAGYSPKTARITAAENLAKPNILEAVKKRKERLAFLSEVTDKEVLGATVEIAFASIEDALDDQGRLDFAKAKENGSASLIKKITRTPTKYGETVSVEFYAKDSAQSRLGEYLGMKQQERANDADVKIGLIKSQIEARAREKGTEFKDELHLYLERYADTVVPELKDKLTSELGSIG